MVFIFVFFYVNIYDKDNFNYKNLFIILLRKIKIKDNRFLINFFLFDVFEYYRCDGVVF